MLKFLIDDIIFEILEYLTDKDIESLSRVNHRFRLISQTVRFFLIKSRNHDRILSLASNIIETYLSISGSFIKFNGTYDGLVIDSDPPFIMKSSDEDTYLIKYKIRDLIKETPLMSIQMIPFHKLPEKRQHDAIHFWKTSYPEVYDKCERRYHKSNTTNRYVGGE